MKKLEDIPKKQVFDVPEGYFENLPTVIQARVASQHSGKETMSVFSYCLRYALPAACLLILGIFWFNRHDEGPSAEFMLASIQTEALVAYLSDTEITTDELLEDLILNSDDVSEIESEVYGLELTNDVFEDILDEI